MPCEVLILVGDNGKPNKAGNCPGAPIAVKDIPNNKWGNKECLPMFARLEIEDMNAEDFSNQFIGPYQERHEATEEEAYLGIVFEKTYIKYRYHFDLTQMPASLLTDGQTKGKWADFEFAIVNDLSNPEYRNESTKPDTTELVRISVLIRLAEHYGYVIVPSQAQKTLLEMNRWLAVQEKATEAATHGIYLTEKEKQDLYNAELPILVAQTSSELLSVMSAEVPELSVTSTDRERFLLLQSKDAAKDV